MKRYTVIIALLGLLASAMAAEEPPRVPETMHEHLAWAKKGSDLQERIRRYEGFWEKYLPLEEGGKNPLMNGYGDAAHVYAVWGCAWGLARSYVEAGQKKALEMLDWIQMYDSRSMLKLPPTKTGRQGGADQPAPAPEPKPQAAGTPQPE